MTVINKGPTWAPTQTDDVTPIEFLSDAQIAAGNYRLLEREPWYMRAAGSVGASDIGELTAAGFSAGQSPRWDGTDFLPADYYTEAEADALYGKVATTNTWALAQTFSGQILAAAGTSGAPGISFSGDTNTGITGNGDLLQLIAGGASRMNVTTSTVQMLLPFWATVTDAAAGTQSQVGQYRHNTSNTVLANFGSTIDWQLQSSTTINQMAAQLTVQWNDPTHATKKADMVFSAYDTAAREFLRGRGAGSAAAISFLGGTPQTKQTVTGSRGGNAALASLLTALAAFGLITDSTTA